MKFSDINKYINEFKEKYTKLEEKSTKLEEKSTRLEEIIGINVKYPPAPLNPCKVDGTTDDTSTLRTIISTYANAGKKIRLIIPEGTMVLNNTVGLFTDVVVEVDCRALIKSNLPYNNTPLFVFRKYNDGEDYLANKQIIRGLRCTSANSKGICFYFGDSTKLCRDIQFEKCVISDYNKHCVFSNNSYLIMFNQCTFVGGDTLISADGTINCGENITFNNSILCNAKTVADVDMRNGDIRFEGCSIDFNNGKLINLVNGQIYLDNCHIEFNLGTEIPFTINSDAQGAHLFLNNTFMLCNTPNNNLPQYMFNCGVVINSIKIDNCNFVNCRTASGVFSYGDVIINSTLITPISEFPSIINSKRNLVYDGNFGDTSLEQHKHIKVYGNMQTTITGNRLKIYKNVPGDCHCYFIIDRHDYNSNNVLVRFKIKGNPGNTIPIWVFKAKDFIDSNQHIVGGEQLFGNPYTLRDTDQEVLCKVTNYDPSSDKIIIKLGLTDADFVQTNTIYISELYVDEI